VAAHERRTLQCLHLHELRRQAVHGRVQLLDAVDGVDLRHLARDLRVVHRIERVLVLHLRDQQFQESVGAAGRVGARAAAARERGRIGGVDRRDGHGGSFSGPSYDWPICKVLSSSVFAVFMTSTLFWYERDAEIMLTISSTALTLL